MELLTRGKHSLRSWKYKVLTILQRRNANCRALSYFIANFSFTYFIYNADTRGGGRGGTGGYSPPSKGEKHLFFGEFWHLSHHENHILASSLEESPPVGKFLAPPLADTREWCFTEGGISLTAALKREDTVAKKPTQPIQVLE